MIAMLHGEGAESEQSNGLAGGDGINNRIQDAVDNSGSLLLAECVLSGNFLDEFGLIHSNSSFSNWFHGDAL